MKTKCSRLIRVIEAIMCFVVGCALLLMLDPSMRHLLADVFLRPHSEVAIEQTVSSPGPMRQPTERICRFHGTEWDTRIEYVKASPKEVIDAMDKAYAALPQASCPAFLPMARALAAASVPLDSYVIESNSITRVYGSLPVGGETGRRGDGETGKRGDGETGRPVVVAIAWAVGEESVLITMKLRDPTMLWNIAQPVDRKALRSELDQWVPECPFTTPMDKVENATKDWTYTTYMVQNACSAGAAREFYASHVPGIETLGVNGATPFQSIKGPQGNVTLVHLAGEKPGESFTMVKIRRSAGTGVE